MATRKTPDDTPTADTPPDIRTAPASVQARYDAKCGYQAQQHLGRAGAMDAAVKYAQNAGYQVEEYTPYFHDELARLEASGRGRVAMAWKREAADQLRQEVRTMAMIRGFLEDGYRRQVEARRQALATRQEASHGAAVQDRTAQILASTSADAAERARRAAQARATKELG